MTAIRALWIFLTAIPWVWRTARKVARHRLANTDPAPQIPEHPYRAAAPLVPDAPRPTSWLPCWALLRTHRYRIDPCELHGHACPESRPACARCGRPLKVTRHGRTWRIRLDDHKDFSLWVLAWTPDAPHWSAAVRPTGRGVTQPEFAELWRWIPEVSHYETLHKKTLDLWSREHTESRRRLVLQGGPQ